ncbi:matrixin family metalloprotease [Streptomyces sp. NPDC007971]|uniref:matrixin family metalloprotease n=1 Tax=Streptomyces sp. NPDC007971 TaxID=3364799 RepID=UPI0036DFF75F
MKRYLEIPMATGALESNPAVISWAGRVTGMSPDNQSSEKILGPPNGQTQTIQAGSAFKASGFQWQPALGLSRLFRDVTHGERPTMDQLSAANFIAFERNGGSPAMGGGWESCDWVFDDGKQSKSVRWFGEEHPPFRDTSVVANGSITGQVYRDFFGIPEDVPAPDGPVGPEEVISFLLFSLSAVDMNSPDLTVTVSYTANPPAPVDASITPDIDAMGTLIADADVNTVVGELISLSNRLATAQRPTEAVAAARAAVDVQRESGHGAGQVTDPFLFAVALRVLIVRLIEANRQAEVGPPVQEAIDAFTKAAAAPGADVNTVVGELISLSNRLATAQRPTEAVAAARAAVDVQRESGHGAGQVTDPFLFAVALRVLIVRLIEANRQAEVGPPVQEAIDAFTKAAAAPGADVKAIVGELISLSNRLATAQRPTEAVATARAAVDVQRVTALRTVPTALEQLGYPAPGGAGLPEQLRLYESVWGLSLDGHPFEDQVIAVAEHLDGRFCGVPDALDGHGGLLPLAFGAPNGRWSRGDLSWSVSNAPALTDGANAQDTVKAALDQWHRVPPGYFNFNMVQSGGNIPVQFGGAELNPKLTAPEGVKGVTTTTAHNHAFTDAHVSLDSHENWDSASLLSVSLHEIGHALGLAHSTDKTSLMYPIDTGRSTIDEESQRALASIYGWTDQTRMAGATADRPGLAVAGISSFTGVTNHLGMAWRGAGDDHTLYWSEFGGQSWSPQKQSPDRASTHGPALALFPAGNGEQGFTMAWKGAKGDSGIWYASRLPLDADWGSQRPVPAVGTSCGPALAYFNGRTSMAWKGVDGDTGIYFSTFGPQGWEPQSRIAGVGTSDSPSLVATVDRLYLFWKGIPGDSAVYYSWLDSTPNSSWWPQRPVQYATSESTGLVWHQIGASRGPSATMRDGSSIVLAWRGPEGDDGIWFTYFDFALEEFSGQVSIHDRGTLTGPAIAVLDGRLFMTWRGVTDDEGIWYASLG